MFQIFLLTCLFWILLVWHPVNSMISAGLDARSSSSVVMYNESSTHPQLCGSDCDSFLFPTGTKGRTHTYSIQVLCQLLGSQLHSNTEPQVRFLCQDLGSVKLIVCGNVMADLGLIPPILGWMLECRWQDRQQPELLMWKSRRWWSVSNTGDWGEAKREECV